MQPKKKERKSRGRDTFYFRNFIYVADLNIQREVYLLGRLGITCLVHWITSIPPPTLQMMKLRPEGSETGDTAQVAGDQKKKKSRICQLWVWNFKGRHEKHPLRHLETWTTCRAEELTLLEDLICATCCFRRFTHHTLSHLILRGIPCIRDHSPKESDEENRGQGGWVTCLRLYEEWVIKRGSDPEYCSPWLMFYPLLYLTLANVPPRVWTDLETGGKVFQDDLRKREPLTLPVDISNLF